MENIIQLTNIATVFSREEREFAESFSSAYNGMRLLVSFAVRIVLAIVLSKKAKELGLSAAGHFCLVFFLGIIGMVISLILIDKRKKALYAQNQYMNNAYQNPYGQPQNQYDQYGQTKYEQVASASAKNGQWTVLENTDYTIPSGASRRRPLASGPAPSLLNQPFPGPRACARPRERSSSCPCPGST